MVSRVRGFFKDFNASIYTTGEDFTTAEIDIWISTASIFTGDETRDAHLKSADFFDTKCFRQINFVGNSVEKIAQDRYALLGELTIKRITKRIRLDVEFEGIEDDPWGGKRAGFVVTGKINRKDWGLIRNVLLVTDEIIVDQEVLINCKIELTTKIQGIKPSVYR
jgi:polyisoprenoid-binding protein YceI